MQQLHDSRLWSIRTSAGSVAQNRVFVLSELLSRAGFAVPVRAGQVRLKTLLLESAAAEATDVLIMGGSGTTNPLERLRGLT